MKRYVTAPGAPPPGGPYSHAVAAQGGLVFLAGQGPTNPVTGEIPAGFEAQARQTLNNLATVAEAAGGSLRDAIRVGVFMSDMSNFPAFNAVYSEFFEPPYPARTTVQSNLPGFEIEIDAVLALAE